MNRRLFVVLWSFTTVVELISLQSRLAIFGGMGWLTTIKFTSLFERLGFSLVLAVFCAGFCGLWVGIFHLIGKKLKLNTAKVARWCATGWVVLIVSDLFFRHKVSALLGNAFSFFDFATGVGGVWRMLEQAFGWYGDVILMALGGIIAISIASYLFFKWFLSGKKRCSCLDRIPRGVTLSFLITAVILGVLFMSIWAPYFPGTSQLLANETMFGATINHLIRLGSDVDGDGYGAFDLPPDLAPLDASVHPHAIDIPNDGIDQDALLGDLSIDDVSPQMKRMIDEMGIANDQSFTDRRHVIVVIMESVRHDMLDAQIRGKYVMPNMRQFIDEGAVRIDGAFATRGFTQNSVTQTFWGSYFDPGHSLVDDFKTLGYHTAAFSGEDLLDESFDESLGWNRAGDTVVDPRSIPENIYNHGSVPASVLMNHVESFISQYDDAQPLFLYVFYQDPHFPYQQDNPPVLVDRAIQRSEITAETRPRLYQTYANQVHHLDMAAGRLVQALKDKKMLDDSLVIFISDHGESLFDDGYLLGHGIAIRDVMTHCVMTVYGAHHAIPAHLSHVNLRKFIYDDFKAEPQQKPSIQYNQPPVLQFIGATTVPSAISYRYEDGQRITYEFARQTGSQIQPTATFPDGSALPQMPNHGDTDIDAHVDPDEELRPGQIIEAPIPQPLNHSGIRDLIHTWEYLQWRHRQN